jgi:methanogenic corrinoid protein MtbC1
VHNYGLVHTYQNIIYPLLQQVGLLWCSKQIPVSQEHFLSHLILQKLYAAIEQLPEKPNSTDTWLLFLPENEFHIIGLLISSYILQSRGKKVIFIGANTPESIINNIIDTVQITHVLFFKILHTQPDTLENYLKNIVKICKTQKIHIAANNEVLNQINNQKVIKLYSIKQLIEGVY